MEVVAGQLFHLNNTEVMLTKLPSWSDVFQLFHWQIDVCGNEHAPLTIQNHYSRKDDLNEKQNLLHA